MCAFVRPLPITMDIVLTSLRPPPPDALDSPMPGRARWPMGLAAPSRGGLAFTHYGLLRSRACRMEVLSS